MTVPPAPASVAPGTVRNFHRSGSQPAAAETDQHEPAVRLETALRRMPKVGDEFGGFRLVRELGRGSFGRVFLATQPELSGRAVALKVSVDLTGESHTLAQLQHTNIVPVYSTHTNGLLQAVCMPYFGSTTLADVIRRCRAPGSRPTTGMDLVNTIRGIADETRPATERSASGSEHLTKSALARATADARTDAVFAELSRMSFPQAVCWLVSRVADGLAHAHDRGILHRDVKPANVLVTDDGQPMLLDFGVAEDLKVRATATAGQVGGTIPYMAPEHLEEVRSDERLSDHRSDLYSLGVILYEMLTGRHPFRTPDRDLKSVLPELIAERKAWVPDVRAENPDVPADLESILRKCVAADPADRYQSAADLRNDLECHLWDQPLKVAREPSVWGRVKKWRRRHPRFVFQLVVAVGLTAALVASAGSLITLNRMAAERDERARQDEERIRELARLHAGREFDTFQDELRHARYLLTGRTNDRRGIQDGIEKVGQLLARYRVTDDPNWDQAPAVTHLPADRKQQLREFLSDACLFLARGHLRTGAGEPKRLLVAARFNQLAESLRNAPPPRAVLTQRAEVLTRLKETATAEQTARRASEVPLVTADDYCLSANELAAEGKFAAAQPLFQKAVRVDPTHFWSHFGLAHAYQETGRLTEARASYATAIALRPDFVWSYYNRAMASLQQRAYDDAVADLDKVAELRPEYLPALLHRGQALTDLGNTKAALRDLDAVLAAEDTGLHVTAYLFRARAKRAAGDAAGAKADTDAGLKAVPADGLGWLVRAHARLESDPQAALADLDEAVKHNPASLPAHQNRAYILDKLRRNEECLAALTRLTELAPAVKEFRTGRAVVLARLTRYEEALSVLRVELTGNPPVTARYHAACVYALAGRENPTLRAEAVRTLAAAIRDGYPTGELATDQDLDPIRNEPEFLKLLPKSD